MTRSEETPVHGWRPLFPEQDKVVSEAVGLSSLNPDRKENGFLLSNENAFFIRGLDLTKREEGGRQVFDFNSLALAAFRQTEDGIEISHCQDSVGIIKNKDNLTLRVSDGVGGAVFSQFAAVELAKSGLEIGELPSVNLDLLRRKIEAAPEMGKMTKEVLIEKVNKGFIAASTLVEVEISGDNLTYRQLGDGGIIVIRPDRNDRRKFGIILETTYQAKPGEPPSQVSWCKRDDDQNLASPQIFGEIQTGELKLQRGDIIIVATDGLLKIEKFMEKLKELIRLKLSMKTTSSAFAQGINEGLMRLVGEKPPDDVAVIVYIHQ